MKYWLLKSEPNVWSINQQKKSGNKGIAWDGVRNYQAANNLKQMKKGDNIVLAAFGGGFTWGSIYIKWAYDS